jgi:hypothetical protein
MEQRPCVATKEVGKVLVLMLVMAGGWNRGRVVRGGVRIRL